MTDHTLRSAEEARTHELLAAYMKSDRSAAAYRLASAILACWSMAHTADRWAEIANVLVGVQGDADREVYKAELSRMVRAKVLRTRTTNFQRVKVYEVNY